MARTIAFIILLVFASHPATAAEPLPAFPGAEGAGMHARGGRGGDVYHVTNLDDAGPGSLRCGITSYEPSGTPGAFRGRTIVFDVTGVIDLQSSLNVDKPFLTIAGQSAPGKGISLKGCGLIIDSSHDVIVRYIRCQPGDIRSQPGKYEPDALGVEDSRDVIIDHVSAVWATDENLSVTHGSHRVTVQWCIIAQALYDSRHHKGPHSYGSLINGGDVTFHHNLYAHNYSRNPRPQQSDDPTTGVSGGLTRFDFVNNVIYNPGEHFGYSMDDDLRMNYIGNVGITGPNTEAKHLFVAESKKTLIYQHDNLLDGEDRGWKAFDGTYTPVDARFDLPAVTTHPAGQVLELVLQRAGASKLRDLVDERIIASVRDRTGSLINSQEEVGSWPQWSPVEAPADTDRDGMPDEWERSHDLDPDDPADRNLDRDGDGYTELEEYLNDLVKP